MLIAAPVAVAVAVAEIVSFPGAPASVEVVEDLSQACDAPVAIVGEEPVTIYQKSPEPGVFGATIVLER